MRDNHQDDEDMFATPRVFDLSFDTPKQDPKIYLEKAWGLLKPAIRSIFLDEPYSFSWAVNEAWGAKSGEALFNLILDECGTYYLYSHTVFRRALQ